MQDIAPIIAPTQPGSASGPSPSPTGGSDETPFSSYLNEATSADQAASNQPDNTTGQESTTSQQDFNGSHQPATTDTQVATAVQTSQNTVAANSLQQTIEQFAFTKVVLTPTQQATSRTDQLPEFLIVQNSLAKGAPGQTSLTGGQTLISAELEQLINLHEQGVITITRQNGSQVTLADLQNMKGAVNLTMGSSATPQEMSGPRPEFPNSPQMGAELQAQDSVIKTSMTKAVVQEETPVAVRNNDQQTTHLRQDSRGQYLEAKIESTTTAGNNSANTASQQNNQQSGQQDNSVAASQSSATAQNAPSQPTTEGTQSYSQVSQGVLDTPQAKGASATLAPPAPFPGSSVSDEAIVQQVANRFNIQARNQETQINIRLHPAELGELKIDLTYREGAIRANVFAQSQHVHEILEKNMPRLREILQSQGIQVEDIQISSKSDIAENFDMLQEQFGRGNNYEQPQQRFQPDTFVEALEAAGHLGDTDQEGVNVTV